LNINLASDVNWLVNEDGENETCITAGVMIPPIGWNHSEIISQSVYNYSYESLSFLDPRSR